MTLNVTISDAYPIPAITSTLSSLGKAKYFTTLDLTSGFYQIHMKESDIPKTAFSTLNGKYELIHLPIGLKNSPAIFQGIIDDVLKRTWLRVNPEKTQFLSTKVEFLGYVVTSNGINADEKKVEAIHEREGVKKFPRHDILVYKINP